MMWRRAFRWFGALILFGIISGPALIAVLAWRQPDSVTLPAPTGPYAVGRLIVDWRDDSRIDAFAPQPGTKRELPVWIWYPAAPDARAPRADYMPARVREAMRPDPPLLIKAVVPDREALHWAAGCAAAAHAMRLRRLHLLDSVAVRSAGAVLTLFCAFDAALPAIMTLAYRADALTVASGLGDMTPGDDYQRLVPLMTAISSHSFVCCGVGAPPTWRCSSA